MANESDLPLPESHALPEAERPVDLQPVRDAARSTPAAAGADTVSRWIDPVTHRGWGDPGYYARMDRERRYCEQIRDAKAAGQRPLTAEEFFR